MSALPLARIPVGVVVERQKAESAWIDFTWRSAAVLPGNPNVEPWTVLATDGETTSFYAGAVEIDLYPTETGYYRDNIASGTPALWVVLRATGAEPPYRIFKVTADPAEGEGFTQAGDDLVDAVPMPATIRATIGAFVAEHHVEESFHKRERDRADPQALARRSPLQKDRHE